MKNNRGKQPTNENRPGSDPQRTSKKSPNPTLPTVSTQSGLKLSAMVSDEEHSTLRS
jgi:hypothetical protein